MTKPPRVEFDPNVRLGRFGTYVALADVHEQITEGTDVILYEPEEGIEVDAVFDYHEDELAYFSVDWASVRRTKED